MKKLGLLRVHPVVEIIGLDRAYFGGLSRKDKIMLKSKYSNDEMSDKL